MNLNLNTLNLRDEDDMEGEEFVAQQFGNQFKREEKRQRVAKMEKANRQWHRSQD